MPSVSGKWIIFLVRFTVMFFLTGTVKTGGILFNSSMTASETSAAVTGLILILPYAMGRLCGPLVSVLLTFSSYQILGTIGGLFAGAGYVLTGLFAVTIAQRLAYATLSGVGFALMILPSSLSLKDHFQEDYPSIMPMAMMGSYAGIIVLPPLMDLFQESYGATGTYALFGVMCWTLIPCGLLLGITPRDSNVDSSRLLKDREEENEDDEMEQCVPSDKESTPEHDRSFRDQLWDSLREHFTLFGSLTFCLLFIVANLRKIPADGWTLFLIPHTIEKGFHSYQAARIASIGGVTGIIGRIFATLSFQTRLSVLVLYASYFLLNGAVFVLMEVVPWLSKPLVLQYIGSALNGCLISVQSGMTPGVLALIVSDHQYKTAYGVIDFGNGVLTLAAGVIPAVFLDQMGAFDPAFYLFGAVSIFNGLIVVILWYFSSTEKTS